MSVNKLIGQNQGPKNPNLVVQLHQKLGRNPQLGNADLERLITPHMGSAASDLVARMCCLKAPSGENGAHLASWKKAEGAPWFFTLGLKIRLQQLQRRVLQLLPQRADRGLCFRGLKIAF